MLQGSFSMAGLVLASWLRKSRRRVVRINTALEVLERRSLLSMVADVVVEPPAIDETGIVEECEPAEFVDVELDGGLEQEGEFDGSELTDWSEPGDENWTEEGVVWDEGEFVDGEVWTFGDGGELEPFDPEQFVCYCGMPMDGEETPCDPLAEEELWDDSVFWTFMTDPEAWNDDGTVWEEIPTDEGEILPEEIWTFEETTDVTLDDPIDWVGVPRWIGYNYRGHGTIAEGEEPAGEFNQFPGVYYFSPMMNSVGPDGEEWNDPRLDDQFPGDEEILVLDDPTVDDDGGLIKTLDEEFPDEMIRTFGFPSPAFGDGAAPLEAMMSSGPGSLNGTAGIGAPAADLWGGWQLSLVGKPHASSGLLDDDDEAEIL